MNLLAIDTSTKNASVSLKTNGNIFTENIENEITHSEKLLPLIDKILVENNLKIADIDMFLVTTGPGSFTGIRIGLATIKALAHVNNIPIYTTSTLDLISYISFLNMDKENLFNSNENTNYFQNIYFVPLIDAKNKRVYYSVYDYSYDNNLQFSKKIIHSAANLPISSAIEEIKGALNETYSKAIFLGTGLKENYDEIYNSFKNTSDCIFYDKIFMPDSKYLFGHYEANINKQEQMKNYLTLDALYARISQAERRNENE